MLTAMSRIAIIGGGNIGEALLGGLLNAGRQARDIVVSEKLPSRARYLSEKYSVQLAKVTDAIERADFIVVAVKPSDVGAVVDEIADAVANADDGAPEHVYVSVVAGVSSAFYEAKLPAGAPVVRVMPNAPMVVGAGISALAKGRFATTEHLKEVSALFDSVGSVLVVGEHHMDAVTAVSGSGPAYFFLMIEAMIDAAVAEGLTRGIATDLVVQTVAGSAAMLIERLDTPPDPDSKPPLWQGVDTTPAQLRATITSPGGTTAAALRELERGGLRSIVAGAVHAARTRSAELGITSE